MESPEGKISSVPTKVLYIPKLPPSLSDWNILKTHFSKYGEVANAVLNPQKRWCTVSFKSVTDAKSAKAIGCVWKNKTFDSHFWNNKKSFSNLDPKKIVCDIFGYSDLDALWNDEDVENFGVIKSNPVSIEKPKEKSQSLSRELKDKSLSREKKDKSDNSLKMSDHKLKRYNEKFEKLKASAKESVRPNQKDVKKRAKSISMETGRRKHLLTTEKKVRKDKEENANESPILKSDSERNKLSLKEKFSILEERDKLIRKNFVKNSSVKCKAVVGTCPDMCPEKERIMREYRRLVAIYEIVPGTQSMDHCLAVKAYVRSSADQEEPLPHELRPEPVLSMTMSYLINEIMPLIEDPDVNISEWYDFCWDRLRSIRKDIIQQQLCDLETVTIIEQCARFHICCYDRLWGFDPLIFDEKINTENLINCLQSLRHMYEDLSKENIKCSNEAEFNCYMILLNMRTGDLMATYQQFLENFQRQERIQSAVKIYLALNNSMYSQFFKLVKKSTYLDACLLQRYFYHVRVQALQAIAKAYCPPNKSGSIPLKQMMKILKFDSLEDTKLFCQGHGLILKENKKDFRLNRNDFFFPENKIIFQNSSQLVTKKRVQLVKAVVGNWYYFRDYKNHKVHSSFTKDGKLNQSAFDASDQKTKSFEIITETTDKMEVDKKLKTEFEDVETIDEKDIYLDASEDKCEDMDVDPEVSSQYPNQSSQLIPYEKNSFNNDPVSRKQQIPSSFRFDLKLSTPDIKREVKVKSEVDGPFKFSLGSGLFDNKNVLSTSDQAKHNELNLRTNPPLENSDQGSSTSLSDKDLVTVSNAHESDLSKSFLLTSKKDFSQTKCKQDKNIDKDKFNRLSLNKHPNFKTGHFSDTNDGSVVLQGKIDIENQLSSDLINKNFAQSFEVTMPSQSQSSPLSSAGGCVNETETKDIVMNQDDEKLEKYDVDSVDIIKFSEYSFGSEKILNKKEINSYYKKKEQNEKLRLKNEHTLKLFQNDLKRMMKATTARHFIRKWKKKVDKIKIARKEFPLLISVSADRHSLVWGTALKSSSTSGYSLLNRLKEKQHNLKIINAILEDHILTTVPYLGDKIIENIANNSFYKLNIKDFNVPVIWKLIVSIPFLKDNDFFINRFKDFLTKVFYKSENLVLGTVVKGTSSQNVPIYYCVHLVYGNNFSREKDKITGLSGAIFFTISGIESSADKCKRLKNLLASDKTTKSIPVAVMKIGKEDNNQLMKLLNEKLKKKKINGCIEKYWNDFSSVDHVLKFLIDNSKTSSNVSVYTIHSLLKNMLEHLSDFLTTAKTVSDEYEIALSDPNIIITFYNSFLMSLESLILDSNFREFSIIPSEFKEYVEYLNKPGESCNFEISFNKSRRPSIVKAFSKIYLPNLKPWPPQDAHDFLKIFTLYCDKINCSNILPRIVRMVDLKDDDEYDCVVDFVKYINSEVQWISVIDLIINNLLWFYCEDSKKVVVLCDKNKVDDLRLVNFGFKLLQCIIEKT